MTKHKNSKSKANVAVIVVFYALCCALGLSVGRYVAMHTSGGFANLLLYLIAAMGILLLALLVQIILHEAGHMVAGLVAGWRFVSFRIFGVMLVRRRGRLRFASFGIPGTGGQCLMSPPDRPADRCRLTLYNAGGFAANLVVAIAALAAWFVWRGSMAFFGEAFLLSLALTGIFLGLQNGLPMVLGGIPNDGMNIRHLRRDPCAAQVFVDTLRVNAMLHDGARLRDMPDALFGGDGAPDYSNGISVMQAFMRLSRAMDRLDFAAATALADGMAAHIGGLPGIYVNELNRERIFLRLMTADGAADIDALYDKRLQTYVRAMSSGHLPSLRFLYAIAVLRDGDMARAGELRRRIDKVAEEYFSPGEAAGEMDLVRCVDERRAALA